MIWFSVANVGMSTSRSNIEPITNASNSYDIQPYLMLRKYF
jgi:hypothetical protein